MRSEYSRSSLAPIPWNVPAQVEGVRHHVGIVAEHLPGNAARPVGSFPRGHASRMSSTEFGEDLRH